MQKYKASELFGRMNDCLNNEEFENSENIDIDFTGMDSVDLKTVKALFDIQKIAVLNNKKLSFSNMTCEVKNMLDITGFNKTFSNYATNPLRAVSK